MVLIHERAPRLWIIYLNKVIGVTDWSNPLFFLLLNLFNMMWFDHSCFVRVGREIQKMCVLLLEDRWEEDRLESFGKLQLFPLLKGSLTMSLDLKPHFLFYCQLALCEQMVQEYLILSSTIEFPELSIILLLGHKSHHLCCRPVDEANIDVVSPFLEVSSHLFFHHLFPLSFIVPPLWLLYVRRELLRFGSLDSNLLLLRRSLTLRLSPLLLLKYFGLGILFG